MSNETTISAETTLDRTRLWFDTIDTIRTSAEKNFKAFPNVESIRYILKNEKVVVVSRDGSIEDEGGQKNNQSDLNDGMNDGEPYESFRKAESDAVDYLNVTTYAEVFFDAKNPGSGEVERWYATLSPSSKERVNVSGISMFAEPHAEDSVDMTDRPVIARRAWNDEPVYLPKVGDPATYSIGSDSYARTVVQVSPSGKTVFVTNDEARAKEGSDYYGKQDYRYYPNPRGGRTKFTLRQDGSYRESGSNYGFLNIGSRRHYSDPSF